MDVSTVQDHLVGENETEEKEEGNVPLPGRTEDNNFDQDEVDINTEDDTNHMNSKTYRIELNEPQASENDETGCSDEVIPFVLEENTDYNNVILTPKCTTQIQNECCSDEVVPFVLDEDFDYDNVVLTPKFTIRDLKVLPNDSYPS